MGAEARHSGRMGGTDREREQSTATAKRWRHVRLVAAHLPAEQ